MFQGGDDGAVAGLLQEVGGVVVVDSGVGAVEDRGVGVDAARDGRRAGSGTGGQDAFEGLAGQVAGGQDLRLGGGADEGEKDGQGVVVSGVAIGGQVAVGIGQLGDAAQRVAQ